MHKISLGIRTTRISIPRCSSSINIIVIVIHQDLFTFHFHIGQPSTCGNNNDIQSRYLSFPKLDHQLWVRIRLCNKVLATASGTKVQHTDSPLTNALAIQQLVPNLVKLLSKQPLTTPTVNKQKTFVDPPTSCRASCPRRPGHNPPVPGGAALPDRSPTVTPATPIYTQPDPPQPPTGPITVCRPSFPF